MKMGRLKLVTLVLMGCAIPSAAILAVGCRADIPAPATGIAPHESKRPAAQGGEASVYHDKFHGRKTASGETFDQNELTAASKTLPLGSTAKVTNKKTGKSTLVRINDRGPYAKGRTIDLSKAAAKRIQMDPNGVAPVVVKPIEKAE